MCYPYHCSAKLPDSNSYNPSADWPAYVDDADFDTECSTEAASATVGSLCDCPGAGVLSTDLDRNVRCADACDGYTYDEICDECYADCAAACWNRRLHGHEGIYDVDYAAAAPAASPPPPPPPPPAQLPPARATAL